MHTIVTIKNKMKHNLSEIKKCKDQNLVDLLMILNSTTRVRQHKKIKRLIEFVKDYEFFKNIRKEEGGEK